MCPSCGRDLGGGEWKACPGCGADLVARRATGQPTGRMPAAAPGARVSAPAADAYQPTAGMPYQRYQQAQYQPAAGNYPPGFEAAVPGCPPGYASAAGRPGGSVLLGLLTLLSGGAVAGSTFLQWVTSQAGAGVDITGWFVMRGGFEVFGGGGFELVIAEQGTIFFTGFFSLLLGALILLGGIVTLIRRRPGGILTLLFALAASVVSAVNITMAFVKMQGSAPGVGLWMFAGAALAALALGIISLSSAN